MERFKVEFSKLIEGFRFLHLLMWDWNAGGGPTREKVQIQYIIFPEATKFLQRWFYGKSVLIPDETPDAENSPLTLKDINTHRIVPAPPETHIWIEKDGSYVRSISLDLSDDMRGIGYFCVYDFSTRMKQYNYLRNVLPVNNDTTEELVIHRANDVTSAATVILTLIYNLFHCDEKIKMANSQYIEKLTYIIKNMGDDFLEVFENLHICQRFRSYPSKIPPLPLYEYLKSYGIDPFEIEIPRAKSKKSILKVDSRVFREFAKKVDPDIANMALVQVSKHFIRKKREVQNE
jgi:hypothetical protein